MNKTTKVTKFRGASQRAIFSVESGLLVELLSKVNEMTNSKTVITTGTI